MLQVHGTCLAHLIMTELNEKAPSMGKRVAEYMFLANYCRRASKSPSL